jgi:hypothetical protein
VSIRIHRPAGASGTLPVLIFTHGAGWVFGDAHTHDRLVRELTVRANAATVFVNYGLSPEHRYPVAIEEIYATLEWVVDEGAEHHLDPARIAGFQRRSTSLRGDPVLRRLGRRYGDRPPSADPSRTRVAALLAGNTLSGAMPSAVGDRRQLIAREVLAMLGESCARKAVLLAVEDLRWADASTLLALFVTGVQRGQGDELFSDNPLGRRCALAMRLGKA